ncbi:hypothetical protein EJ05DRAFT_448863 [Pseudovirgaria hyperparasitica]|uniref:Calponin-homology (CH) domain-containing protein n=1 Tax=Pseudovirgaria hyperparasitica TaxID=470096 RepID=A0A6A6WFC6_9PEZI|nr:uncharacterized protein EJ05DRAFT_448863 [Pseudovirgaria hyperparasitica]KAF2760690.1 hypothetical protein EJ05DRAFT_448863 [Pseudovirgaria hyperparasitica]
MRRYSAAGTPCPGNSSFGGIYPGPINTNNPPAYLNSTDQYYHTEDTTANLDYTTELKASIRNARPRRPKTLARKNRFDPATEIYIDHQVQAAPDPWLEQAERSVSKNSIRRTSTLLARPAQRLSIAPQASIQGEDTCTIRLTDATERPNRRRISAILEERQTCIEGTRSTGSNQLVKDPRRRTIYVPSEYTTIMTLHPGAPSHHPKTRRAKSPDLGLELVTLSEEETTHLVPAIKQVKASRKSLAVPPKKGVLLPSRRTSQSVSFAPNLPGSETGKENIPPGKTSKSFINMAGQAKIERATTSEAPRKPRVSFLRPRLSTVNDNVAPSGRKRVRIEQAGSEESPAKMIKSRDFSMAATERFVSGRSSATAPTDHASPFRTKRSPPSALRRRPGITTSVAKDSPPLQRFPVLRDDLPRPELYEDNWLDNQEVALSQLINNSFRQHDQTKKRVDPAELRQAILGLYHDPTISQLHKRLQASLSYGALNIPDDVLSSSLRLKDDIGLRQRFLELWVESYNLQVLKAAVEVVVGREVIVPTRNSTGTTLSEQGVRRRLKKALEDFINAFVIRNEDAIKQKSGIGSIASIARAHEPQADSFGSQRWSWRRTVLRSLMIILLLDKAKNANVVTDCLFQTMSAHKTSASVLQQLARMLLPSLGDITRPLGHVQYQVSHTQHLLQEYRYRIRNIATDLRDGVLLARLVELVLYDPVHLLESRDDTITISLPTGDVLQSDVHNEKSSWLLSQHLKLPAASHAQKHYNVQIALSALKGMGGTAFSALDAVTADDIVDGHREKTLGLLWTIVGRWGLKGLVDWKEVEKETDRFRRRSNGNHLNADDDISDDQLPDHGGHSRYEFLLREWTSSIARLHHLHLRNLTTSFADGRIFEAIVDEYLPFCKTPSQPTGQPYQHQFCTHPPMTLAEKLGQVGCSRAFITLFSTPTKHYQIPSKDFILISLAFLASRLIPLSISHRAASVIQRVYRKRISREEARRRIALMRLASHCAVVVRTRERVVGAAIVLQRAWRDWQTRRLESLGKDVMLFQSVARGWQVRTRHGAGRGGTTLGHVLGKSTTRPLYRAGW